jgi:hypothetical protein
MSTDAAGVPAVQVVRAFTTEGEAQASLAAGTAHMTMALPPRTGKSCAVAACGTVSAVILHLAFVFSLAFLPLFGMVGGTVGRGWSFFIGAQYLLTAVEMVTNCCEFGARRPAVAYALAGVGLGSALSAFMLLVAAILAADIDWHAKCIAEQDMEARLLSVAYPFDCDPGGQLHAIWAVIYLLSTVVFLRGVSALFACLRCGFRRRDALAEGGGLQQSLVGGGGGDDGRRLGGSEALLAGALALLAAACACACIAGFFLKGAHDAPGRLRRGFSVIVPEYSR